MQPPLASKKQRPKGLVLVLSVLPAKQIKLFKKYLQFEPFNAVPKLVELFGLIEGKVLKTGKLHLPLESLLPGSSIRPKQLNKLVTLLHQKLDLYLSLQLIQDAPHRHLPYILEAYNRLGLGPALSEKRYRQIHKKLHAGELGNEHFFQHITLEHFALPIRIGQSPKVAKGHFQDVLQLTDLAYVTTKMKYLCASLNEASILNLPPPTDAVDHLLPLAMRHREEFAPYSEAYFLVLGILQEAGQAPEAFQKVLNYLFQHHADISQEDLFDLYNYLLNVIYRRIDIGERNFVSLAGATYDSMLELGLLTMNGKMHSRIFKNIVSINCKLQRFAWCETFIQEYQHFLEGENAHLLPRYCSGLVQFYAGDHLSSAATFRQIMQQDPEDYYWGFESRNLLLKSLFHRFERLDVDEHEELLRLVESFRMYIRRNFRLSDFRKKSYLNFIRYFSTILKFKDQVPSPEVLESLHQEIQTQQFVTHKAWLLARLKEK